jgi:hypothetical protein
MNKSLSKTLLTVLSLSLLLSACTLVPANGPDTGDDGLPEKNTACPQLHSQLYQLIQAEDPLKMADELGYQIEEGKILVVLVLASQDTDIPDQFNLEPGTLSGNQVQVFAPMDALCDLANTDAVIAVNPPAKPVY